MTPEQRQEHADLLRKAIEESEHTREAIADMAGRTYRTVGYWTARTKPTMPNGEERALLRRLLGPYDEPGDVVERALRKSTLTDWRQSRVLAEYQRNLAEQRAESVADAG